MSRAIWPGVVGLCVFVFAVVGYYVWDRGEETRSIPPEVASETSRPEPSIALPEGAMLAAESRHFPVEKMPTVLTPRNIHTRNSGENWREAFCDETNWSGLDLEIEAGSDGDFFIDGEGWEHTPTSTRVGLASFISECRGDGQPIRIRAAGEGALLAEYHASSGLRSALR